METTAPIRTPDAPPTRVSVLMPAYNAERFVEEAIRSTLRQTHRDFELIVINDGSTDRTGTIVEALAREDDRIRVISHANMGMGRSLNLAAEQAKYEWLVRMDADDVMAPNRIERQLAFLRANPGLVVASSLVRYIDAQSHPVGQNRSEYTDAERFRTALRRNDLIGFHHPAVIMRRDVFLEIGGYRAQFWPCDDLDLWNRIVERYPEGLLVQNEQLLDYRIHEGSVCVSSARRVCHQMEWIHACVVRRRAGLTEPTAEEFAKMLASAPLLARLARWRRSIGRTYYKAAAIRFSNRQFIRFVPSLLIASLMEPSYVLHRLLPGRRAARTREAL